MVGQATVIGWGSPLCRLRVERMQAGKTVASQRSCRDCLEECSELLAKWFLQAALLFTVIQMLLFVQRAAKIPHACSRLVLWIPHRNVVGSAGGPRRFSGVSARPQGVWRLSDSASVALDPAHLFAFALT